MKVHAEPGGSSSLQAGHRAKAEALIFLRKALKPRLMEGLLASIGDSALVKLAELTVGRSAF